MSEKHRDATILVVDDNPVNLQLLFEYLGREGFRVLVCEDGESAVEQARQTLPDLILMDVLLPGMSGYDSCRAIHALLETADVPVIFLTALSRTSDRIEGFAAGGVDYLTKPLQFKEVLARMNTHLSLGRVRQELEEKNRELERRDRRREQLFGIIAHDLRSPLGTCISGFRLLRSGSIDEGERGEVLKTLEERMTLLDSQIADLLKWGELQIAGAAAGRAQFDLSRLLESVVGQFSTASQSKGVLVQLDASLLEIRQDETAIRTVVNNLVANAVKFTPAGGSITVSAEATGAHVVIRVADTGIGMTDEERENLFIRGARVHRSGTEGEPGTGLGLLLSQEIAELIGGEITATSSPGAGSTLSFSFDSLPITDH